MPFYPSLANTRMGPIFGVVSVLCVTQTRPLTHCSLLWRTLTPGSKNRPEKEPSPTQMLVPVARWDETLVSSLGSVPPLAWTPQPQNHSLYSGRRPELSPKPTFPPRPLCFISPKRCHALKDCTCQKTARGRNWYILLLFLFIKKKSINVYACPFRDWI